MAKKITNSLRRPSLIRVVGASAETIELTELAKESYETVQEAQISRILWSSNGSVTISRDTTKVAELYGSGEMRLSDYGYSINDNPTANIKVTIVSGGTVILDVTKSSIFSQDLGTL